MTDIKLHFRSAKQISTEPLPGPSFVLQMADDATLVPSIKDEANVARWVSFLFNDADSSYGLVRSPERIDAQAILKSFEIAQELGIPNFVAQCQNGVGRSQAVIAALCKKLGRDNSPILRNGTYNRKLYDLMLAEMGIANPQPLVSIVVRCKYPLDRLQAFYLSMKRQRHINWELIAVTDGPGISEDFHRINSNDGEMARGIEFIETPAAKGRWGHPYRQLGIDAARGQYIGLQNDDNLLTPGFIEQLLFAIESQGADMAVCQSVHSYSGWDVAQTGSDLGCWIAKADLVKRHPWTGIEADYEWHYLQELCKDGIAVSVERPLFMKN